MAAVLTPEEVREYLSDYPDTNLLLDKEEFSDTFIELAMDLAISDFNAMPPRGVTTINDFPSKGVLLYGTCWQMYQGRAALMARNHLTYTDGGLQIPVEEKFELYMSLASNFRALYAESARALKNHINLESGWGRVVSDEYMFPMY